MISLSNELLMSQRSIITIGNFDGVHLGHQAILKRARELGDQHGVPVRVITFDPHPAAVLRPGSQPLALSNHSEKDGALKATGADEVAVLPVTSDLLSLSADAFVEQMVDRYSPIAVVEGVDFRFGKERQGDVTTLAQQGKRLGFEVAVIDGVEVSLCDQTVVVASSSLVRWLLGYGRVADAARCLGGAYTLTGEVVTGDQRGRSIGVPTINLDAESLRGRAVPCEGVYGGSVQLTDGSVYPAAISIGCQPTFGCDGRIVEAHLLGYEGDLYGQTVAVGFGRWLRDQQAFPGVDTLRDQLGRDVAQVNQWHGMGLLAAGHQPHVREQSLG